MKSYQHYYKKRAKYSSCNKMNTLLILKYCHAHTLFHLKKICNSIVSSHRTFQNNVFSNLLSRVSVNSENYKREGMLIRPWGDGIEIKKKLLTRVGTFICHESKLDLLTRRKSIQNVEFSSFET